MSRLSRRILALDAYLLALVFLRNIAVGLGLGVGIFFAALLLGIIRKIT